MLYDISPPLIEALAVWPGDVPLRREVQSELEQGATSTTSNFRATAHLGAHADAPSHVRRGSPSIEAVPLETYLGPCQVVRVSVRPRSQVRPADLPALSPAPRVLIATGTYPDVNRFDESFAGLAPELIEHLADRGVLLIGTDTPSVDVYDAEDLPAHRTCVRRGVAILEGLVLSGVPEGEYELIALPLRFVGFDASPVRAVLRD